MDIVFVGFDAIDDAVAAVEAGTLAATVAQQPALMGELGVETAAEYLSGGEVEASIPVDLSLIDMAALESGRPCPGCG